MNRVRRRMGWALVVWAVAGVATQAHAQADKDIVGQRQERIQRVQVQQETKQKADTEVWAPAKIVLNLDVRCPVITALGYFGAFATTDKDPAKAAEALARYAQLQKVAQPIAEELKKIATTTTFMGTTFPSALEPQLNALCGELYGAVLKLYGDDGLNELKQYVATLSQGAVVGREKTN